MININKVRKSLKTLSDNGGINFDVSFSSMLIEKLKNQLTDENLFDSNNLMWDYLICGVFETLDISEWEDNFDKDDIESFKNSGVDIENYQHTNFDYFYRCFYVGDGETERFIEEMEDMWNIDSWGGVVEYFDTWFENHTFNLNVFRTKNEIYFNLFILLVHEYVSRFM